MSDELKKLEDELEGLQKEYDKLRGKFDRSGNLTDIELDKYQQDLKVLREKYDILDKQTLNPVKGPLRIVSYHSEQIQMALGKIEKGINKTGELEHQTEALKSLFERYEEVEHSLKGLNDDFGDMEDDIQDERKKESRKALREIVAMVIKRSRQKSTTHG